MIPSNTDLVEFEAPGVGKQQKFDIESEAVKALNARQGARQLTREELEAALCVSNPGQPHHAENEVKRAPHEIPVPWLGSLHQPSLDGSRTDRH